jgi:hypothetical protein
MININDIRQKQQERQKARFDLLQHLTKEQVEE